MSTIEAHTLLNDLDRTAGGMVELAKTAKRGGKSLSGDNPYGHKFQTAAIHLAVIEGKLRPLLSAAGVSEEELERLHHQLNGLKDPKLTPVERTAAVRALRLVAQTVFRPRLDALQVDPTPKTERVLPMDVVRGSGTYYERLIQQANGCYEQGWYDACLVMIRKFFESAIIAVYETHGKVAEIKKDGEFLMLRPLVDKVIGESAAWNLGRETKPALREIREDGNRSAHTRRYNAVKADIDKLIKGIRVAADELLHLAKLK